MAYLIDTNVLIEAKNRYYGFDICPAFWDWLDKAHDQSKVLSITKVLTELQAGSDELTTWAETRPESFFVPPDNAVLSALPRLSQWASTQGFRPSAVSAFLDDTDYWLVAQACAHGHTVITHERPSDGITQIKIPKEGLNNWPAACC